MPTPITALGLLPEVNKKLAAIGVETVEAFSEKIDTGYNFIEYIGFDAEELIDLVEEVNEIAPLKRGLMVHRLTPEEQVAVKEIDAEATAKVNEEVTNAIRRMNSTERKKLAASMVSPIRGARRKG